MEIHKKLNGKLRVDIRIGTAKKLDEVIAKLGATKAFIVTGQSLSTRTPVIKEAEASLGSAHVGTFNKIGQHAYGFPSQCLQCE